MKKIKLIIIGLAVFFLLTCSGYAQTPCAGKPAGGRLKESIYKELNLTPQQQKKLEENRKVQAEKASQLRTVTREKEKELQQALKDPAITRAKVEPLVNEIKSLQAQLIDQRVSGIFAVKEILSPEQIAKFNQLMEKGKEGRKGHFKEWRERRKGMEHGQE